MPEKQRVTLKACQQLLSSYESEGSGFLYSIVTGDYSWVHHYEPELKNQSLQYCHPTFTGRKKFKIQPLLENACPQFSGLQRHHSAGHDLRFLTPRLK
jgi:hypothetical protein